MIPRDRGSLHFFSEVERILVRGQYLAASNKGSYNWGGKMQNRATDTREHVAIIMRTRWPW